MRRKGGSRQASALRLASDLPASELYRFNTMPVPSLPPELLKEIITLATASPQADYLTPEWSNKSAIDTLLALCLTSRTFSLLASGFLYSHLSIPTAEVGRALVRTLQSERWTAGELRGKAKKWVKALTLGVKGETEGEAIPEEEDDGWVGVVLTELEGGRLERVALAGLNLSSADGFKLMPGVRFLSLDEVDYIPPSSASPCHLPRLTQLRLTTTTSLGRSDTFFLDAFFCPALTHLAFTNRPPLPLLTRPLPPVPATIARPSQARPFAWTAQQLATLRRITGPGWQFDLHARDERAALGHFLRRHAGSLLALNISAQPFAAEFAAAVADGLEEGWVGVKALKRLVLPCGEGIDVHVLGREDEAERELRRVVAAARARGVEVEWVGFSG